MPTIEHAFTVRAPLAAVWAFHLDPANLPRVMPPGLSVRGDGRPLGPGALVQMRLGGALPWVQRVTEFEPPHRFVDTLQRGPFSQWDHEHTFEAVDASHTRVRDRIRFSLGRGRALDALFAATLPATFGWRAWRIRRLIGGR